MALTRRFFIGGAASLGALGGCRLITGGNFASGVPRLKFGVVSDIHLSRRAAAGENQMGAGNELTFVNTLKWFRDQGVDGVIVAGDMADFGVVDELVMVAEAWNKVFPNDRAPDGRKVERLFVYGNHDMSGTNYVRYKYKDKSEEELNKIVIYSDPKGAWEKAFNEEFAPIWSKEIKGYNFVGAHWWSQKACRGKDEKFNDGIGEWYAANAKKFDPSLPFFHIQHPHPLNTCYGPWAWGSDVGLSTKTLSAFPNAVAFSGHSHYPLLDERSVWQGEFTSVGTASLRYVAYGYDEFGPYGFANSRAVGSQAREIDAAKVQAVLGGASDCRQGMLWSIYDDCMVVQRREFISGIDLGEDWTIPLPSAESKPFAFAERAKKIGAPEFAEGAKLKVVRAKSKTRGARAAGKKPEIAAVEKDCLKVIVPAAIAKDGARAYQYVVTVIGPDGKSALSRRFLVEGLAQGSKHSRVKYDTNCFFAIDELPKGAVRFKVEAINCFGRIGGSLLSGETIV